MATVVGCGAWPLSPVAAHRHCRKAGRPQFCTIKDDVKIMKKLGLNAYRFSISWSRVLPHIEPFVTLFHWDLPQALQVEYSGFLSLDIVEEFCQYAELCFSEFGDRVKHWITLNDPWSYCIGGYVMGILAPSRGHNSPEKIALASQTYSIFLLGVMYSKQRGEFWYGPRKWEFRDITL
ncbi:hypothetical protein RJ639_022589 [Escallonia herrerae]|uniref:Beta-glucosidase n=1 Tax=Escallonia herrerae TaxID=1293975 RepID=A0AA88V0G4_9ASTE|nr:hypothetical protein RJ639_022589 [Escallonia herrerae]